MFRLRSLIVLAALIGCVLSDGAPYSFNYEANDEGQHQRNEQGQHGQVQGSYSYVDPNGHLRQVNYVADEYGFRPSGDIGVDRETEAAAADLANQAPPSSINFNPPGGSQGGSYGGGSYGGQSSQRSNYGGQSQKGYSAPRPRPSPPRAPRPSYQSPSKQGYQQRPAAKQWKPSKPSYQQQQQQDDYSGSSGDTYSFNTQITHAQPSQRPYGKPSSPASYGKQRPQKPAYKQPPPPPPQQQQQQQDWQDDGSYDQSNDWSEQSSGPKQSVAYEVRAPTHKIIAKYN